LIWIDIRRTVFDPWKFRINPWRFRIDHWRFKIDPWKFWIDPWKFRIGLLWRLETYMRPG
jgi:hypothetical protein